MIFKPLVADFEMVSLFVLFLHACFVSFVLLSSKYKYKYTFLIAYLLRVGVLLWDIYGRNVFLLPNSGADTEHFYRNSLIISENISKLFSSNINIYPKLIGVLVYLIGEHRILIQYINVLLGLSSIVVLYKTLVKLDLKRYSIIIPINIISFLPNLIILSAILLRESILIFFVILSLYYFVSWFKQRRQSRMILSLFSVFAASLFHSGVIGIVIGYLFCYLFYDFEKNEFSIQKSTWVSLIVISIIGYFVFVRYDHLFLGKFRGVDSIQDIYSSANSRRGASAYLSNITIDSFSKLLLYSPIKAVYFMLSPLPMNWRGITDIISFLSDSIVYLILVVYSIKNREKVDCNSPIFVGVMIGFLSSLIIFSIGVSNAGTAMRHRQKLSPLLLVLFAIAIDIKYKKKEELSLGTRCRQSRFVLTNSEF